MGQHSCRRRSQGKTLFVLLNPILHWEVTYKKRFSHRGGYATLGLVFGEDPRLPQLLLSDDARDTAVLQTVDEDFRKQSAETSHG